MPGSGRHPGALGPDRSFTYAPSSSSTRGIRLANPVFERFSVTPDPRPFVVANPLTPGGPDLQYQVTYQVANLSALSRGTIELLMQHHVPLNDPQAMHRHLRRLLDAREPPSRHPALNRHFHPEYQQRHTTTVQAMDGHGAPYAAVMRWTSLRNDYTGSLNSALREYVRTGNVQMIENEDPEDSDEPDRQDQLSPLEEEQNLLAFLLRLPDGPTDTLRISYGPHSTVSTDSGELAISGRMVPGDIVSNYPMPMSTTSSNDLEQFGGFASYGEARVSRFIGTNGRPLLVMNQDAEEEEEVLFSARGSFQIIAVAHARADRLPPRVAAIYVEVEGVDPAGVPNLHTGELPRYRLPRIPRGLLDWY